MVSSIHTTFAAPAKTSPKGEVSTNGQTRIQRRWVEKTLVIPVPGSSVRAQASAGIYFSTLNKPWIPACAGMTA